MARLPQPKRARADYPKGVRRITDNGGNSADRYTVEYEPYRDERGEVWQSYVAMSGAPFHPQGVGLHGERQGWGYPRPGRHLLNFADLNEDCKRVVLQDLALDD